MNTINTRKLQVTWLPALPSEGWTSMDRYWRELHAVSQINPPTDIQFASALMQPPPETSVSGSRWQRVLDKYVFYPSRAGKLTAELFHVLDHSYAHLIPKLPSSAIKMATVFDLVPLEDRGFLSKYQVSRFQKTVGNLRQAHHIVSISEETRGKLISILGIPPVKISVVRPGTDFEKFQAPVAKSNGIRQRLLGLPSIIFSVGACIGRKNLQSIPSIFQEMKPLFDRNLCCFVRAGDFLPDSLKHSIVGITGKERFIELGPLFGEDLIAAYQASRLLIFPSILEGLTFVIPEAMASGCPVVTNTLTANPEAGGDAALYYTEGNAREAAEKIIALLTNDNLHSSLRNRGIERAREMTWSRHFNALVDIYRQLLLNRAA